MTAAEIYFTCDVPIYLDAKDTRLYIGKPSPYISFCSLLFLCVHMLHKKEFMDFHRPCNTNLKTISRNCTEFNKPPHGDSVVLNSTLGIMSELNLHIYFDAIL